MSKEKVCIKKEINSVISDCRLKKKLFILEKCNTQTKMNDLKHSAEDISQGENSKTWQVRRGD